MSLICETIVSEDELSRHTHEEGEQEEELDFEEEEAPNEDKDEGELDDDEDLEEGEVKEDDDDEQKRDVCRENPPVNRQNSICRFYGRGQCTWGNNCRFVHPTGGIVKRLPPPPPPPPMAIARRAREWTQPESESAWERGLKQAKEMIVRASRRKEEETDFEDKRFNLSVEENQREVSSPQRNTDRYDEEYERRRRLAFESAPWNNEEPPGARMRQAETYRDPWRRSKSPPPMAAGAPKARRPPPGSRSGSKRSHSMSSISASGSDSSDFSGSEGSESFSESSASNASGRSGGGRRVNRKTSNEKKSFNSEQKFQKKANANNWNKGEEKTENYDSWSESLSDSDSISSYYSGSDSEDQKRIPKRQQKNKKDAPEGPPAKKTKTSVDSAKKEVSAETHKSPKRVQMTFKKQQNIKKENFNPSIAAFKANNGREDEVHEEEPSLSPKAKSLSPASPVSQESPTSPRLQATFSRREELLQQLKAVEDAIARKRSKIN